MKTHWTCFKPATFALHPIKKKVKLQEMLFKFATFSLRQQEVTEQFIINSACALRNRRGHACVCRGCSLMLEGGPERKSLRLFAV